MKEESLKLNIQKTKIMTSSPIWEIDGEQWKQWETLFLGAPKSLQMVAAAMKLNWCLFLGRKLMTNLDSILRSRDITLPTEIHLVKALVFPVVMYGCESWTIKKIECWRIDALELWCWRRLLRIPCKETKPVNPKRNQPWIFIGRTDAEAETPIVWLPDAKNWLIEKGPDAEKDQTQKKRGTTEDEMVGWHSQLNGHEFE